MTFQYISEGNDMQLTQSQEDLLSAIEGANCKLNGFSSILDLRNEKSYKVIVSDRESFGATLDKEIKAYSMYHEEFYNHWASNKAKRNSDLGSYFENADPVQSIIRKLKDIRERLSAQTILGLYRGFDFSYNSPAIYLFKENIENYAMRHSVQADNVFGFVYVHEAMHAYYNSKNINGFLPVTELEEAFAECGMINFLEQTGSALPSPQLAQDARYSVAQKQNHGPYDYGFGLELADIPSSGKVTFDMMSKYRRVSNRISPFDRDVNEYQRAVLDLKKSSPTFDSEAHHCYDLVVKILDRKWSQPPVDFTNFPSLEDYMRKAGVTLKPGATSPVIPVPSTSIAPASKLYLPNSGAQPSELVELFASTSLDDIAQAIFKSQKVKPETMDLLGRMGIKAKLKADPSLANINTLLRALQFWCDITLAILDTDGHYVLYGPEALAEEFKPAPPKPTAKTTSTVTGVRTKYDLTDLQSNVFKNLPMVRLAIKGIKSYAKQYPSTIAELQKKFPQELRGHWKSKGAETVMSASSIPANDRDYKSDMKDLIPATDGPAVINRNWDRNNIGSLISIFEKSGMKITPSSI